jgi:hypothetical protein
MKSIAVLFALAAFAASVHAAPPAGHPSPAAGTMMPPQAVSDAELTQKGKVVSTIDATEYTYIEVAQGKNTVWLAAPAIALKKGSMIRFEDGAVMTNFRSKLLNRTFPSVMFVNRVVVEK